MNSLSLSFASIKPGERIITVNFDSSVFKEIGRYSLPCKNTDAFIRLERTIK